MQMTSALQIEQMSRIEKLQTMEAIWDDLSHSGHEVASPDWHRDMLKETEAKVAAGQERIADWELAKRELRLRVE